MNITVTDPSSGKTIAAWHTDDETGTHTPVSIDTTKIYWVSAGLKDSYVSLLIGINDQETPEGAAARVLEFFKWVQEQQGPGHEFFAVPA